MADDHDSEVLAEAVTGATSWADLMRSLGVNISGGGRRVLQERVHSLGIDTSHFTTRDPWRKYSDAAIAEAVSVSTTLREVADKLGATPSSGMLSHIRRRITAARVDVGHFPGLNRLQSDLPFTREELVAAAAASTSVRSAARLLGAPGDTRARVLLRRMLDDLDVDTSHFAYRRCVVPEDVLTSAVGASTGYADVMRKLGLTVNSTNHRRIRRLVAQFSLDTSHFTRAFRRPSPPRVGKIAEDVLRLQPAGSSRANHSRLRRALEEIGMPYACEGCGNTGDWRGATMTLQIDHINGVWRDNRRQNLRYLCPNCHAITDTWCGRNRRRSAGSCAADR